MLVGGNPRGGVFTGKKRRVYFKVELEVTHKPQHQSHKRIGGRSYKGTDKAPVESGELIARTE